MAKPWWVVAGVAVAVIGLIWTLQGVGVIGGSAMSGTVTWSIIGPVVVLVGIGLALAGRRARRR